MNKGIEWFFGGLAVVVAAVAVRKAVPEQEAIAEAPAGISATTGVQPKAVWSSADSSRTVIDIAKTVAARIKAHNIVMIGASLSYYALLAVFPAAIAAVSIYGLVADPAALQTQIDSLSDALPEATAEFVGAQLSGIVEGSGGSKGLATVIGILVALWSASAGTKALISGTNIAYGATETRKFFALRGVAYGLTITLIVGLLATVGLITALPALLDRIGMGEAAQTALNIGRWPVVFLLVVIGFGGLYKFAPNRPASLTRFINRGGIAAAVLWVLATVGFSFAVNNFGSFGETYGALAGLIVLMIWFFLSGLIILIGAEVNSELEAGLARTSS